MNAPAPPTQPDPRNLVSAQLLLDLVNDTLDPGYAAAARRREQNGTGAPKARYAVPAVAVGCGLIGFLLVVAYVHANRGAPEAAKVHQRLVQRVRTAQNGADALATRASALETQVNDLRSAALPQSGTLATQLQQYLLAAGQTAVTGPGLTVTLTDPAAPSPSATATRGGSTPITATNRLTDSDVRSVVNELWHDGAEAISVDDIRLTPTSAIRFAGEAVLVDFQPITSPYRIEAIGNQDALSVVFAQSSVASRFQTLIGLQGIGFTFGNSSRLQLPAGAVTTLREAHLPKAAK